MTLPVEMAQDLTQIVVVAESRAKVKVHQRVRARKAKERLILGCASMVRTLIVNLMTATVEWSPTVCVAISLASMNLLALSL